MLKPLQNSSEEYINNKDLVSALSVKELKKNQAFKVLLLFLETQRFLMLEGLTQSQDDKAIARAQGGYQLLELINAELQQMDSIKEEDTQDA